ncbi:MAG: PQQ-dependent sugar dehydrogenase [Blastocatellia bacterium]
MGSLRFSSLMAIVLLVLACSRPPSGQGAGETGSTADAKTQFQVETVVTDLEVPWSIAFTPDGRMLIAERAGRVRVVENGKLRAQTLGVIRDVEPGGESGLMGLTLHPRFAQNHFVYLAYAYQGKGKRDRVVRYRETGSELVDRKVIIEDIPAAQFHAGCRLRFGPGDKLYITTGDATDRQLAQRLDSLAGKILRLNDDGTVPPDNPFVNRPGARPEIWTYGHRNPQGIDWQPDANTMFETEHGPSGFDGPGGGDELNLIEKGKNYGWPVIHHKQTQDGLEPPLLEYTPAVAPASGVFYRGTAFPEFRANFFFGCLRAQCIVRVVLEGRRPVSQEAMLEGSYGRIRDVAEGPDGAIYFSTSNRDGRGTPAKEDDRILKLVPMKQDK